MQIYFLNNLIHNITAKLENNYYLCSGKEKNPQGYIEFYHFMPRKGTTKFKSVFRKIEFNPLIKNKVK